MAKFVIIEGIDGAGKTTIARRLSDKMGVSAIFVEKRSSECGTKYQSSFMSKLKPILWNHGIEEAVDEIDEETWLYFHVMWYHMVQEYVIKSTKMQAFEYIFMDGWYYKFFARHIANNKMPIDLARLLLGRMLKGDRLFFLDASPEVCFDRKTIVKPSEYGIHENSQDGMSARDSFCKYQMKVKNAYFELDCKNEFVRIDAEKNIDSIVNEIIELL